MIITIIIITLIAGVLYRLGGKEGFNTLFRDIGVPLCFTAILGLLGAFSSLIPALCLIPSFGLLWGSLTTYKYFLPKPVDYSWWHYSLHGFFCALSAFPYVWATGKWVGFILRVIACSALMGGWYFMSKWNDDLHEFGRGVIIAGTVPLLLI